VGPAGRALRPAWTGRLARLRGHHVSAYDMTVINNAVPVIDNARRAQVRDAMERYRKRRKCGPVGGLDGSQREAA
jgi:hypothetical protein